MHLFITGTDTGVGKTFVTCLLLAALRAAGHARAIGWKPVCCGDRADAFALQSAADRPDVPLDTINPTWFKAPLAPLAAGWIENRAVDVDALRQAFDELAARFDPILVEGAGGWEVPLAGNQTMADLAVALGLPVLVVVNNRLGALNHTILTVRSIEDRGLRCAGLVLNQVEDERDVASISNRAVLEQFLPGVPILLEIQHGETSLADTEVEGVLAAMAGSRERP